MTSYVVIFFIILIGSTIHGATGFGFSLFVMPLLTLLLPVKTTTIVVLNLVFILVTIIFFRMKKHINIQLIKYVILGTISGRTAGFLILERLNNDILQTLLGIVLIIISIYFIFYSTTIKTRPTMLKGIVAGIISGILGGIFNVGGPPLVLFFLSATEDKKEYQASLQAVFMIVCLYSILLHNLYGNYNYQVLKLTFFGVVAVGLGSMLGGYIFTRINLGIIKKSICYLIAFLGIMIILK